MSTTVVPVEYVWCSGANTHHDLRSKVKSVNVKQGQEISAQTILAQLPVWNFDGSSTNQARSKDTEILIKPVACWPHPFIPAPAFVALAECFFADGTPTPDNTRLKAREVFEHAKAQGQKPWFGLEQEYVLYKDNRPLGWPADKNAYPAPQGPYYCANGAAAWGRKYAQAHYLTCLKMGLTLSGTNAEVMPGQWEYQVGPCEGIQSGDHAVMARWAFLRILEEDGLDVNFDSKPIHGDWNGSGMHTNFSTEAMRQPGGMAVINAAVEQLARNPLREVAVYGSDNDERLSGHHETSRLDTFNSGVGTRHTSVRIPNQVIAEGCGYFEDRRPSASADPWLVTARLFATACDIPSPLLDAHGEQFKPAWIEKFRTAAH